MPPQGSGGSPRPSVQVLEALCSLCSDNTHSQHLQEPPLSRNLSVWGHHASRGSAWEAAIPPQGWASVTIPDTPAPRPRLHLPRYYLPRYQHHLRVLPNVLCSPRDLLCSPCTDTTSPGDAHLWTTGRPCLSLM